VISVAETAPSRRGVVWETQPPAQRAQDDRAQ
jgi:hypothetical protein